MEVVIIATYKAVLPINSGFFDDLYEEYIEKTTNKTPLNFKEWIKKIYVPSFTADDTDNFIKCAWDDLPDFKIEVIE